MLKVCNCRDLVQSKKITFEEAREARKLLNMPGGLELHIGVRVLSSSPFSLKVPQNLTLKSMSKSVGKVYVFQSKRLLSEDFPHSMLQMRL